MTVLSTNQIQEYRTKEALTGISDKTANSGTFCFKWRERVSRLKERNFGKVDSRPNKSIEPTKKWGRSRPKGYSIAIPLRIQLDAMLENCKKYCNKAQS